MQCGFEPHRGYMSETRFTAAYWDERYASSDRVWSGNPNRRLVEQVGGLDPGTALDAGCGEGADVVWLAERGWEVCGLDVSQVALDRAAAHAAERGVGEQTSWVRADLVGGDAAPGTYDLVVAAFLHLPDEPFERVYGALAAAVAPGGSLVVIAHHPDDVATGLRNAELGRLLFTPERVVGLLDLDEWHVVTADAATREQVDGEGVAHVVTDTVVRARRGDLAG